MRQFWEQFITGAIDAMGGEAGEPFGVWPTPPLPKPDEWAKRMLPKTFTYRKAKP
jgi:hypothetical protein